MTITSIQADAVVGVGLAGYRRLELRVEIVAGPRSGTEGAISLTPEQAQRLAGALQALAEEADCPFDSRKEGKA